ncbi:MAG: TetR/AcrR family transcriptional regulator [Rhizobiaceae bacterium]|nr:TetR/AcrR family transcriptional regulator [Rhizobiaceae bacterium]
MARTIAKDHDDKRVHILTRAAAVFAEQGFARASMSEIAKDCGISKATIYHYYESKNALLFDILDTYLSALRDRIFSLSLNGLPPRERLRRVIAECLLAYEGMDNEHKIQTEGIPLLDHKQRETLRGYQRDMVKLMGDILTSTAPQTFRNNSKVLRSTVMSVFGMINWFYMWNSNADSDERRAYAELVTTLTINGIGGLSANNPGSVTGV